MSQLSAGEKQKLEILKLLYLDQRFMILDEPTSVLTPGEADEMLGLLRGMTERGENHRANDLPQVPRGEDLLRPLHRAQARGG
ncbi:MAG: ATP-binding cassette domain-containing protein [Rhizobium sp.]|nr:ATP-binding cassette domain-containing protein [Rhizobium sp.]